MSAEANKAIARRYFETGERDELAAWDDLCARAMTLQLPGMPEPVRGLDEVRQFTAALHSAFSDYRLRINELIAEGDQVECRLTMSGTHTAPLLSPAGMIPPTGKHFSVGMTSFLRFADDRIMAERVEMDLGEMMRQLGVSELPNAAGMAVS
jgi:predicted ester cyclase